jgi:tetratricopeptide (TPR) repeat protein
MFNRSLIPISARLAIYGVFSVLLSPAVLPAQDKNPDVKSASLRQHMDAAHRAERAGNLDEAAEQYRAFFTQALDQLAIEHEQLGETAKTIAYFDEALQLTPDALWLRRDYAIAAFEAGDLQRAERLTRAILANPPQESKEQARAHQLLGRILLKMNRDQEARKEMEASIALDPNFEDRYGLAVVCLDMDDEGCATQIFAQMKSSLGDTPALHMQFGRAYGNSDFSPRAVAEFREAIAEDPRLPGAHYSLAAALLTAGEDETSTREAEAELKKEQAISPRDFLTWAALGKLAAKDHRNVEAESDLKQAIALNPHNPDAYLYLGQLYSDSNRPVEAEAALRQAIQHTTDIARNRYQIQKAHFLLGRILMTQHREDQAHAEMQIAHTLANKTLTKDKNKLAGMLNGNPDPASPSTAAADSADTSSFTPSIADPQDAIQQAAFEKRLAPAIADSYNNLGAIAAGKTDYTAAYNDFAHAAVWNPALEGLDYNLGRAAFMASKFIEAIPPLSRILRVHREDSGVRNALAMSLFMTQDYRGCAALLQSAEAANASIPQMQYIYAESLVKTGQIAPGSERLQALAAAHPEIAEVHRGLAEVHEQRGERPQALEELRSALRINANDAETYFDLGKIEIASGNAAAAVTALEAAVRLAPNHAEFHRQLASAYQHAFRMGDAEKERLIYEKLVSTSTPTSVAPQKP